MLLYYVRHGDPIYNPDSLTPFGHEQARALSKRLSVGGFDRIYASTSNRALLTASYTCEALGLEPIRLDFANEGHAWREMTYETKDGRRWFFNHPETRLLCTDPEIRALGDHWYEHPLFEKYDYRKGVERVRTAVDDLLLTLGYEHDRYGRYRVVRPNDDRIAIFAHAGFGSLFFSCLFDIPYPDLCAHYDMCTTGVSVIEFHNEGEWCVPALLTHSNDSHIYKEGLPTNYNHGVVI